MSDTDPQKKGGEARAIALSPERRKEIARLGGLARAANSSAIPKAEFGSANRPLKIGEIELDCFVLNNSQRVISQRGMFRGLAVTRGGPRDDTRPDDGGAELPRFATQKWLSPHLSSDLEMALRNPILFSAPGFHRVLGYPATILPEICDAILSARAAGDTTERQKVIVERAEQLIRAFAKVGIIALVDEATGYQAYRARDELQRILAAYISPKLLPWTKRFPDAFYEQLHRVWGWPYQPGNNSRNAYIGKLTNELIYEQLPPGVLDELKKKSPKNAQTGRRRTTLHQGLTEDVGHPSLQSQISATTTLLRATPSGKRDFFKKLFYQAFPPRQGRLFEDPPADAEK
ncbi:P63C domain-containing protein [Sphingomonas sp. LY54]|uniref:P63C domain-containing protein n=1 Tax=Sphingomonas sp. LY54 TaxID=3095343 RepID=UPI002D784961|nr:P63C domain-containing protein [Sphingomonas sp. LY54]WRP29280.1 P63C domain-containing protein [Sphingomonas sp. LY54]